MSGRLPVSPLRALLRGDNARMVGKLLVITVLMFGFGYALVPIYKAICTALGINVLALSDQVVSGRAVEIGQINTQIDKSRTITVEFDANARGIWKYKAVGTVDGQVAVEAELMCTIRSVADASQPAGQ